MAGQLRLLIPGLLGPVPSEWFAGLEVELARRPAAARLARLLARADPIPGLADGPAPALLAAFGVAVAPDLDLPSAPFCRLADDPDAPIGGYWLHADPVHLHPDRDQLRLFDARSLDLSAAEASELAALFNDHFDAVGVRLSVPAPTRWYLRLGAAPGLRTTPLETVVRRPVAPFLPRGEGADHWAVLLNEAQMLFHGAEVNRRREAAGRPSVNAIWPWGGGALPVSAQTPPYDWVHAAAPLAVGLARWAGIPIADGPLPVLAGVGTLGDRLVYWDAPLQGLRDDDPAAWVAAVDRFEAWLADLPGAIGRGRLAALVLDPCLGRGYRVDRRTQRRLWRRAPPLLARLVRST
ncbi:hypothetical protein Thimo_1098 [Thioflavicoccus mobilis 8321]|uniref:Uncharacterized protein n=1 Tax=Thioflavicoccus mobilis 8321 TaxID=765912 RepID=L0GVN6_9GAMM|nr:hypothetical protein [Thioflavicoccus mobilis]AGA89902.1 hypothetical protein Thimo_1098 [Thioflavicoccus mobilis 8321]